MKNHIDEIKSFTIEDGSELIHPYKQRIIDLYTGWVFLEEDESFGYVLFIKSFNYNQKNIELTFSKSSKGNERTKYDLDNLPILCQEGKMNLYETDVLYKLIEINIITPKIKWYKKGRFSNFKD